MVKPSLEQVKTVGSQFHMAVVCGMKVAIVLRDACHTQIRWKIKVQ